MGKIDQNVARLGQRWQNGEAMVISEQYGAETGKRGEMIKSEHYWIERDKSEKNWVKWEFFSKKWVKWEKSAKTSNKR